MTRLYPLLLAFGLLAAGCKSKEPSITPAQQARLQELVRNAPPAWLPPSDLPRQRTQDRVWDLIHTTLDLQLDFENQQVIGMASLQVRPHFYPQQSITLDAKGFEIKSVGEEGTVNGDTWMHEPKYSYDGKKLTVELMEKTYTAQDTLYLSISYTAKPEELDDPGGVAVSGGKGVYFIDPLGTDPHKPTQVWTQGETEYASCWFPTLDAPNQRSTQDLFITVPNRYTTLSNGNLVFSDVLKDNYRRDHWRLDQPHAPYLFMLAVGEFAVVEDKTPNGLPVSYLVEPEYDQYAQLVFGNTPEMIAFFGEKLGVQFPWPKYSQVVVRDFVSGAMENTTATVHMEALQHDARAHLDATYEEYVSHELFHQWFGDLVTCESWGHIALNEAFATYGEYLWIEYKYGQEAADAHLHEMRTGYLDEADDKRESLIRTHYRHPDDVFDAHSYNKGGAILHMLRNEVGDSAFFASLKYYLTKNAYKAVEADALRMAFEEVTGRDMTLFFDQWFYDRGHPELKISYSQTGKTLKMRVLQTQNAEYQPVFEFPLAVQVWTAAGAEGFNVTVAQADSTYTLGVPAGITGVDFDSDHAVLCKADEPGKPAEWWRTQLVQGSLIGRIRAVEGLSGQLNTAENRAAMLAALRSDPSPVVRKEILFALQYSDEGEAAEVVKAVLARTQDAHAPVRTAAVDYLGGLSDLENLPDAQRAIRVALSDSSYATTAAALLALYSFDNAAAISEAKKLEALNSNTVLAAVAEVYLTEGTQGATAFALAVLPKMGGDFSAMQVMDLLGSHLATHPDTNAEAFLQETAQHHDQWYIRFGAVRGLLHLPDSPERDAFFQQLVAKEAHPRLKLLYGQFLAVRLGEGGKK